MQKKQVVVNNMIVNNTNNIQLIYCRLVSLSCGMLQIIVQTYSSSLLGNCDNNGDV